mgnify:CR=1 FL=1
MNVFQKYYDEGKIKTVSDLKKIYRITAKKIHPDIVGIEASSNSFLRLKNDYDEMFKLVIVSNNNDIKVDVIKYTRRETIELFMDIEATGFFLDSRSKYSKLYVKRLNQFNEILKSSNIKNVTDIRIVEKEINELRSINSDYFLTIKLLIENVLYYHYEPRKFIKASIDKLYEDFKKKSGKVIRKEAIGFVDWIVADVKFGSIYNQEESRGI